MNSWRPFPMVRLAIPLLTGILLAEIVQFPACLPVAAIGIFIAGVLILLVFPIFLRQYWLRIYHGFAVNIVFLLGGFLVSMSEKFRDQPCFPDKSENGLYLVCVKGTPAMHGNTCTLVIDICNQLSDSRWIPVRGLVLARLSCSETSAKLMIGDYLLLKTVLRPMVDRSNPSAFSYTSYLNRKGILHDCFCHSYAWKAVNGKNQFNVRREATFMRDKMLSVLIENGMTGREFAVAAALLLGYTGDIDSGLRKGYAATGAMHILSVSGMHVGIIYIFLELALRFLNRKKAGKIIKALIILSFLWFYALLTGMSPPVIRSAAMLSLPIIARSLNRPSDIVNVLATSLFFILVSQPGLLFDAGFQLSYLAVGGIVFLYKPIYDLYVTSRWLPDKIWSVIAVSLAAQLATLPVTLYYFHQFPNYFLIANLLVVPLSGMIIYTGIAVMIVSPLPEVATLMAKGLSAQIWLLNEIIGFIEKLPGAVTGGVFITLFAVVILYLLIITGFKFFNDGSFSALTIIILLVITLVAENVIFKINRLSSNKIVVYNFKGAALYRFSCQDRAVFLYDQRARVEVIETEWGKGTIQPDLHAMGINQCRHLWMGRKIQLSDPLEGFIPLAWSGNIIRFRNYRICIANRPYPSTLMQAPKADAVIITGNPSLSMKTLIALHNPDVIIIDPTNSRRNIFRWRNEAIETNTLIHIVQDMGPWKKEFFQTLGN